MTDDHLTRLCFGAEVASGGHYTPESFTVRLAGIEQRVDHVVYLHEVHHASLNDMTAWGSLLHLFARLPEHGGERFEALLDGCRTTHESYATYGSVGIASARHGDLADVLAAYPEYVPLYRATERLAAPTPGRNRRQLVVSALARLCMQVPVLDLLVDHGASGFRLTALREIDRPDGRWAYFLRRGGEAVAVAAAAADRAVRAAFGSDALTSDGAHGDLYDSTLRTHDRAWDLWESTAYEHLRRLLTGAGAGTLDMDGHTEGTATALTALESEYGPLGLRAGYPDGARQDDGMLASSVIQQVRHDLVEDPYSAVFLPTPAPETLAELVRVTQPDGPGRALLVHVRPGRQLARLYRWPLDEPPSGGPVAAVRVVTDGDAGDSVVAHAVLSDPTSTVATVAAWQGPGPVLACISASCLADTEWTARWFGELSAAVPVFVLVDVEPERFVPRWAREGRQVRAAGIDIDNAGAQRTALVIAAGEGAIVWLVLADDVTVNLVIGYLRAQISDRLAVTADWFEPIRSDTVAVITHLLATESFTSFDAMGHADVR